MSKVVELSSAQWAVVRRKQRMSDEPGVRFAVLQALLPPVLGAAGLARAGVGTTLDVLVVVSGVMCLPLSPVAAAVSGLVSWAWATGFAENRYGTLTFSSADLLRMAAATSGVVLLAVLSRRVLGPIARHWSGDPTASPH